MAEREPVRRASYGAASPVLGAKGARTREQIVDAALQQFGERGVHGTIVDDIARSVGISRATLYQYFGSKEEIFRELVEESGSAQFRVMRRLGRLGPTAEGFENLHWWLGEVTWVYEKYATLFVQWANVDTPEGPLRPMLGRFLETYTGRLAERLVEGGVAGVDAGDLAIALWAMIERFNYYRHTRVTGLTDDAAVDNLAIVAQLIVFPDTPSAVLVAAERSIAVGRNRAQAPALFQARPDWQPRRGRFASLSDEAFATVRDILDAGARLFASSGYHNTSVNMIIREADRSRGTFYKYFDGKLDVLVVLARECAEEIRELSDRLGGLATSAALRVWLRDFLALHQTHS
jgi:AcrR family transcriptional regulator